jgi:hypothetical protein
MPSITLLAGNVQVTLAARQAVRDALVAGAVAA